METIGYQIIAMNSYYNYINPEYLLGTLWWSSTGRCERSSRSWNWLLPVGTNYVSATSTDVFHPRMDMENS